MVQWIDQGIVIDAKKHGESRLILTVLTKSHGLCKGVVRKSKTKAGAYELGTTLKLQWQARLPEHMGLFTMTDVMRVAASDIMDNYIALLILQSAMSLLERALPEHHPYTDLYHQTEILLDKLAGGEALAHYVLWEKSLLAALGFGLDLSKCGATGTTENLAYISPKTGRAICLKAGEPYHDRLFYLPAFLRTNQTNHIKWADIFSGLEATGYFLCAHVFHGHLDKMPNSRSRLKAHVFRKIDERQVSEA